MWRQRRNRQIRAIGTVTNETKRCQPPNSGRAGGADVMRCPVLPIFGRCRLFPVYAWNSSGVTNKYADFTNNADSSPDTITRYHGPTSAPVLVPTTLYQKSTDGCGSGYDGMGRLTNMQQIFSSASDNYSYVYDAAGNITQMSSTADGTETYTTMPPTSCKASQAPPSPTRATPTTPTAIARRRTTTRKPAQPGRITSCCSMGPTTTSTTRRETAPRSSSIGRGPTSRAAPFRRAQRT